MNNNNLEKEIKDLTNKLISIDTTKNENNAMNFIEDYIKFKYKNKLKYIKQDIWDNWRYNLIISNSNNPKILLAWHIDVVPVSSINQFIPYEKDWKIYWRWSVDMKSWIAIIISLIDDLLKNNIEFMFLFYCDEEYYFKGMSEFVSWFWNKIKPKLVIIPEPTDNKIIVWFRWIAEFDLTIKWKTVHAARKEIWNNAIIWISNFISDLEKYTKQKDLFWFDSSVNLAFLYWWFNQEWNIISRPSMVPDISKSTIEIRLWKNLSQREFEKFLFEYFKEKNLNILDYKMKFWFNPLLQNEIIKKYNNYWETVISNTFWYSDIQMIKEKIGWDCIQIWPGPFTKAHQEDEYVEIDSVLKARKIILNIILWYTLKKLFDSVSWRIV
jgi:acetylornithine deacetylase/succinyl-diaminopimelate desuccinylase-like protein